MFKRKIATFYNYFLLHRHKVVRPIVWSTLFLAIALGAGYRALDIKENFEINGGFEHYVNMASHFWIEPGGYNFEEGLKIARNPEQYIFTHHPQDITTSSFENEKGWEFVLSLIFPEGAKGLHNLALIVVRYQLMLELLVILLLFFSARAIIGPLAGCLAAMLYALFKPSISMIGWVSYYYWAIPFSALSIFFWTVVYRPEKKKYSLKLLSLMFFLYGMFIGFATSFRLAFLFLPLVMSPFIFFRERVLKRSLVLLLVMLIGHSLLLLPQILMTYKYYGKFTLSVRGKWHHVISGLGVYPNPFGIPDSADLTAVKWAVDRGGPDLNKEGIQPYDNFVKKEVFHLVRERPDIFFHNFKNNLIAGVTMTPKDMVHYIGGPAFIGIMDNNNKDFIYGPKVLKFAYLFPWLVLFAGGILFFFWRKRLWLFLALVTQGFYSLFVLCLYFPPADVHTTAYFPVFVLLLAVAIAIFIKYLVSVFEGLLRSWLFNEEIAVWPLVIQSCFREGWDREYQSIKKEGMLSAKVAFRGHKSDFYRQAAVLFLSLVIVFIWLFGEKLLKKISGDNTAIPKEEIISTINNTLRPDMNGGFESWSNDGCNIPLGGWSAPQLKFNKGASVQKIIDEKDVKIGATSMMLEAGDGGDFYIACIIPSDKLYYLLNKNIEIEAWIKSNIRYSRAIYIGVVFIGCRNNPIQKTYYKNTGDWENLKIGCRVPAYTQAMYILCGLVKGGSAYFDGVGIRYQGE